MISALLVYAIIAAIGVLFLAVSAVFSFEHGGAGDGSDGIGPASPTMLSVFATVFGVVGIVLTATFEMDARATPFVALLVALPVYGGSYWTLNRFLKQGGANSLVTDVVGSSGTVVYTLGPNSPGEVAYIAGGRRHTARATAAIELAPGTPVRIVKGGSVLQVEQE
jgi:hypothetical protein